MSLIEVLIVVAILGIIAAVLIPNLMVANRSPRMCYQVTTQSGKYLASSYYYNTPWVIFTDQNGVRHTSLGADVAEVPCP